MLLNVYALTEKMHSIQDEMGSFRREESIQELWGNSKCHNYAWMESREKRERIGQEKYEEVIAKNIPKLMTDTKRQI